MIDNFIKLQLIILLINNCVPSETIILFCCRTLAVAAAAREREARGKAQGVDSSVGEDTSQKGGTTTKRGRKSISVISPASIPKVYSFLRLELWVWALV